MNGNVEIIQSQIVAENKERAEVRESLPYQTLYAAYEAHIFDGTGFETKVKECLDKFLPIGDNLGPVTEVPLTKAAGASSSDTEKVFD